jgi:hypothetical protein
MSVKSSVQDVVRIIVTRNPYLYRGLQMRVVNYTAVARYIQGEVENIFGDEVDPNTVVTAVMRLSNQALQQGEVSQDPLVGSRLNVVTGISEVTILSPPVNHTEIMNKILSLGVFDSYMLSLHQFSDGIKIMTNSPDAGKLKQGFEDYKVEVLSGYAELHIKLPRGYDELTEGMTEIIDALAQNGVYAVDAFFAKTDISLIVPEEDASRAFEVLRMLTR